MESLENKVEILNNVGKININHVLKKYVGVHFTNIDLEADKPVEADEIIDFYFEDEKEDFWWKDVYALQLFVKNKETGDTVEINDNKTKDLYIEKTINYLGKRIFCMQYEKLFRRIQALRHIISILIDVRNNLK